MPLVRRSLALVAVGALTASALTVGSASAETPAPAAVAVGGPDHRPTMAAGVIVKTTTATASTSLIRAADHALPAGVDVTRVGKTATGKRISVLPTSERLTAAEAETAAAELRERSDVVWAAPNYILRAFADPPVPASDSYFRADRARQVWDWRAKTDSTVRSVLGTSNTFGSGGFSSRAPYAWRATRGEGAVVAVLDTGITAHPDLPTWDGAIAGDRMLPGYDFVTRIQYNSGAESGRDGDGWETNPQDTGDYLELDECYHHEDTIPSSWHGTHVAGIIAAEKDNGVGVVGVAPEAKILPVRVLGLCGGTTADIIAGMRWSVGLPVTNPLTGAPVPINDNPADVLNMSLGEYGSCMSSNPDSQPLREAIADVHATGAVIVASAGNDGVNMSTYPVLPASCEHVVAVGATSEYGDRAGYRNFKGTKSVYSNYGSAIDLVAPGGDDYWSGGGIVSSVNSGFKSPVNPTWARYSGTSMSTAVVSAAAAILKSLDDGLTADQTVAALRASVQAFPRGVHSQFRPCSTSICGTGIIDLSKIQAPTTPTKIVGQPVIGEPLTAVRGTWSRIPTSFTYRWLRDGETIPGATAATYHPTQDDQGAELTVRMSPATAAYAPLGSTSAPTAVVPAGPEVTMDPLPVALRYGQPATTTVTLDEGQMTEWWSFVEAARSSRREPPWTARSS